METLNVSLDLEKRLLNIDGNSLELDSSLADARVRVRSDSESNDLYLIYSNLNNSSKDYKKLEYFKKLIGKTDIRSYHSLYNKQNGGESSMIVLSGNIKINIST